MDVTRAATSIQVRWRYVHKCLPDLLRLLRMIPATAPEKLEPRVGGYDLLTVQAQSAHPAC